MLTLTWIALPDGLAFYNEGRDYYSIRPPWTVPQVSWEEATSRAGDAGFTYVGLAFASFDEMVDYLQKRTQAAADRMWAAHRESERLKDEGQ